MPMACVLFSQAGACPRSPRWRLTSYLSSPAAATLHGKTQGFVLRLPPQHKSHARFMQCSHYNAICNLRFNKRIELRTYEQPHVAEHQGRTNHTWKRTVRTRRTHTSYLSSRLQPLYTAKHKVSCSGFLPNTSPTLDSCNAAITMRFATCDSTSE